MQSLPPLTHDVYHDEPPELPPWADFELPPSNAALLEALGHPSDLWFDNERQIAEYEAWLDGLDADRHVFEPTEEDWADYRAAMEDQQRWNALDVEGSPEESDLDYWLDHLCPDPEPGCPHTNDRGGWSPSE